FNIFQVEVRETFRQQRILMCKQNWRRNPRPFTFPLQKEAYDHFTGDKRTKVIFNFTHNIYRSTSLPGALYFLDFSFLNLPFLQKKFKPNEAGKCSWPPAVPLLRDLLNRIL